jgi:hypothetical protein
MGKVVRVVLRFRPRFCDGISASDDEKRTLSHMSFLFSHDDCFPTLVDRHAEEGPTYYRLGALRSAERLSGQNHSFVVQHSLRTLARLLGVSFENLESWLEGAHFHEWQSDPFSRKAYSYGKVGADGAQRTLGARVENTLFLQARPPTPRGRMARFPALLRVAIVQRQKSSE